MKSKQSFAYYQNIGQLFFAIFTFPHMFVFSLFLDGTLFWNIMASLPSDIIAMTFNRGDYWRPYTVDSLVCVITLAEEIPD